MVQGKNSGKDIPIEKLKPLHERDINLKTNKGFHRIISSISALGLIEPLCVYRKNGHYIILDGFLRYCTFQENEDGLMPP